MKEDSLSIYLVRSFLCSALLCSVLLFIIIIIIIIISKYLISKHEGQEGFRCGCWHDQVREARQEGEL